MVFPNKSTPHAVRSSSTLTAANVAGTVFSIDEHNYLAIQVVYTKGDETSMQLRIESSIDGGVTYAQQVAESASAGVITVSLAERTFTVTGNYWVVITPIKGDLIRISARATAGTPTGTLALQAITGWA